MTVARGRFISFEGGEGAGKSTQARLLAEALRAAGHEVVLTREPGGTPGAEAIRTLLLDPAGNGWNARAEALLFAAARSDHLDRLVGPALERGAWVVCDRFLDSSRAYQGGAGGLADDDILALHAIGSGGMVPDLTVLIDVSEAEANARLARRDKERPDRIGGRDAAYHSGVATAFARIAAAEPARVVRIDGGGTTQATHAAVLAAMVPLLAAATT